MNRKKKVRVWDGSIGGKEGKVRRGDWSIKVVKRKVVGGNFNYKKINYS